MKRIGAQDYSVLRSDFAINIEVEGFDLAVFQCVSSQVMVTDPSGKPITTFGLPLVSVPGKPMLRRAVIQDPGGTATPPQEQYAPPCEVTFVFILGFGTPNGSNPRYELRMTSALSDKDTRIIRPPNLSVTTRLEYR
jgi:hypothetical protein